MEEKNKKETQKEGKLSYEELKKAVEQIVHERDFYKGKAQEVYAELQKANMYNDFKRADYLFQVLEHSKYFDPSFVDKCAEEITSFLTIPEPQAEAEKSEEK